MKIQSSNINFEEKSSFSLKKEQTTQYSDFKINLFLSSENNIKEKIRKENYVQMETTNLVKALLVKDNELSHEDTIKKRLLEILIQQFTDDKDFKFQSAKKDKNFDKMVKIEKRTFESTYNYTQKSSINFKTQGEITTNKGNINIDIDLSFSQSFQKEESFKHISEKIEFLDPLIINYENDLTSYDNISSKVKFYFDLNIDGEENYIPTLKKGTGFLALDKNNNGIIDDGSELFGAKTGDGFKELKKFDKDDNNWIDENDDIFKKLLIWEKNEEGEDNLISIAQADIGALYLASCDSKFMYSSAINEHYAKLNKAGVYVKEDGKVGLINSVEFAT